MSLNRNKPLYQPWSEAEFMSDEDVQNMDFYERSMYRTLLQSAFICSDRPRLPKNDERLRKLAGSPSKHLWNNRKAIVLNMFEIVEVSGRKLLERKRLIIDWNREQERRQRLSEKGLKGVEAKKSKYSTGEAGVEPVVQLGLSTELNRTEQTELNRTEPNEENEMSLSDKIREEIFIRTKKVIDVPEWAIKAFNSGVGGRREQMSRFREWLDENPDSEYPLNGFLKVADDMAQAKSDWTDRTKEAIAKREDRQVLKNVAYREDVISLAAELKNTGNKTALYGENLVALAEYLDHGYSSQEILFAFSYHYKHECDEKDQRWAVKNFFEDRGGPSSIKAYRDYKVKQDEVMRLASAPTAPLVEASEVKDEDDGVEVEF